MAFCVVSWDATMRISFSTQSLFYYHAPRIFPSLFPSLFNLKLFQPGALFSSLWKLTFIGKISKLKTLKKGLKDRCPSRIQEADASRCFAALGVGGAGGGLHMDATKTKVLKRSQLRRFFTKACNEFETIAPDETSSPPKLVDAWHQVEEKASRLFQLDDEVREIIFVEHSADDKRLENELAKEYEAVRVYRDRWESIKTTSEKVFKRFDHIEDFRRAIHNRNTVSVDDMLQNDIDTDEHGPDLTYYHQMDYSCPSRTPSPRKSRPKFEFMQPKEAPVFRPTFEEFKNPLEYISKIRSIAESCGICKIVPPAGWRTPFAVDMDKLRFTPRIQRINELEARTRIKLNFNDQLTKFFALSGKTFQVPVMEKAAVDLWTLHRTVKELGGINMVNRNKFWTEIATRMGYVGKAAGFNLKNHYDNLILPFLLAQKERKEERKKKESSEGGDSIGNSTDKVMDLIVIDDDDDDDEVNRNGEIKACITTPRLSQRTLSVRRELKSLKFLGPGPKMPVCEGDDDIMKSTRTRGKKIMYEFDPLARYLCKGCRKGDIEETLVTCVSCEDRYHCSCLMPPLNAKNPPVTWRCPKCAAAESYKPLEEFGFAQAEREYTLREFKEMANKFKENYFKMEPDQVATSRVEQEFWRVVSSIEESVVVEYGADLHVIEHGSAFPRKDQPCVEGLDQRLFNKYASSAWNLNNLPVLKSSVLRHISADISGMKIPWMYAGMCFATFCWHNEDHWSYSINYLHMGEPKTWYGVPGSCAEEFEKAMQDAAPELFECQPDLLHQLVTIMNPNDFINAGVPVYRTDQRKGEFVVTFPRAYHAGFNQGFNFAEACNFAPPDWLHIGRECISHYSQLGRFCVFSHDELVCKMAINFKDLSSEESEALVKDLSIMVSTERLRRNRALKYGVGQALSVQFDKLADDERQCSACNTTVFLSAICCTCSPRLVCLDHINKLCSCTPENYTMKYQFKLDLLNQMVALLTKQLYRLDEWNDKVVDAFNRKSSSEKLDLKDFTELLMVAKEKDFPNCELLTLLDYHVRRAIECAAVAKAIINNASSGEQSKITAEDLELFVEELNNLPCKIVEETVISDLLEKSRKFKRMVQKVDKLKIVSKWRVLALMKMGKTLCLDLPEMGMLEKKLVEIEWSLKVDQVISPSNSALSVETYDNLVRQMKNLPLSPLIKRKKRIFLLYLNSRDFLRQRFSDILSETRLVPVQQPNTDVIVLDNDEPEKSIEPEDPDAVEIIEEPIETVDIPEDSDDVTSSILHVKTLDPVDSVLVTTPSIQPVPSPLSIAHEIEVVDCGVPLMALPPKPVAPPVVRKKRRPRKKKNAEVFKEVTVRLMNPPPPMEPPEEIEARIKAVLDGSLILYLTDLEELLICAKYVPVHNLIEFEDAVSQVRNWVNSVSKVFMQGNRGGTLMQCLWPRLFLPRNRQMQPDQIIGTAANNMEDLIEFNGTDFLFHHFKAAYTKQYKSLCNVRLANLTTRRDREPSCVCGGVIKESSCVVCELCKTHFHRVCFKQSADPGAVFLFRHRNVCSFCKRTNRPLLDDLYVWATTALELKVKIPECFALNFNIYCLERWQNEAKAVINYEETSHCLKSIFHFLESSANKDSTSFTSDSTSISRIGNYSVLELRQLLMIGDMFEIASVFKDHLWLLIESQTLRFDCGTPGVEMTPSSTQVINKSKTQYPHIFHLSEKAPVKKKPVVARMKRPPGATGDGAGPPRERRKKRSFSGVTRKKGKKPRQSLPLILNAPTSSSSSAWEEHEPESNCAAALCLKPPDMNVDWVQCDGTCRQWFHMKCIDLDNVSEEEEYVCTACIETRVCEQVIEGLAAGGDIIAMGNMSTIPAIDVVATVTNETPIDLTDELVTIVDDEDEVEGGGTEADRQHHPLSLSPGGQAMNLDAFSHSLIAM